MNPYRSFGIILLIVGFVCLGFGWKTSHSVVDTAATKTRGLFTQGTRLYLIGGIAIVLGGGALVVGGRLKL